MEVALVSSGIKTMFLEPSEDFAYVFLVFAHIVRVDQDVVKIDGHANVEKISKDVVHESLESGGCIGETKWHDKPFEGSVSGPKGCLPFITGCDTNEVVCMSEVYLGIDTSFTRSVKEVGDKGKGISVFLGNFVKASEINA